MNLGKIIESPLSSPIILHKCGAEGLLAGAVLGGTGLIGSILNNETSSSNVAAQLGMQIKENQKNRDWQTAEAEKSRQFTTSERLAQQQFALGAMGQNANLQLRNDKAMADYNAMYSSPVYQREQLEKAGINPAVYFGQQSSFGGSNVGAGSVGSPSAPSGVQPHGVGSVSGLSPVSYQPFDLMIPQLGESIASTIKSLSQSGVDKATIQKLGEEARNMFQDSRLKQFQADYQALYNKFAESDLPNKLKEQIAHVALLQQQKITAAAQGELFTSQQELVKATEKMNEQLAKLHGFEAEQAQFMVNHMQQQFDKMMKLYDSEIGLNTAKTYEASATGYNQEQQGVEKEFMNKFNDLNQKDLYKALKSEIKARQHTHEFTEFELKQLEYATEQARVAASHAEALFWKDYVLSCVEGGVNVVSAFTYLKSAKSWLNMSKASQKRVELKERELNVKYNQVHVTSGGGKRTRSYYKDRRTEEGL